MDELTAGDALRSTLLARADEIRDGAPLWHGWAIMEAFLAGIDYARRNSSAEADHSRRAAPKFRHN